MPKGTYESLPCRQQLRHWERVCQYLDTQPLRSVRHPLILGLDAPTITTRLLRRMALHGLVRHTEDCRWQLARRWRARLLRLWEGAPAQEESPVAPVDGAKGDDPPFVADRGVDTLYMSLFATEVPIRLVATCTALKAAAQEQDDTVETPWMALGAPLSMYKSGAGTSGTGRGVSWSFILRNAQVMVLLRKSPLAGLIGSVRLSAVALWTLGARSALDALRADLAAMWEEAEHRSFELVRWQLSQMHLCVDVARLAPQAEDVDRLVSRSLKRALHVPSAEAVENAWVGDERWDEFRDDGAPDDWGGVPLDMFELPTADDDQDDDQSGSNEEPQDDSEEPADELGVAVYGWGRRVSGFSFSPGGDLSAVWYDKLLEERLSGKRWMEPIHLAGGWRAGMPLTRIEVRFRRGALRDLMALHTRTVGEHAGERACERDAERWFDDPWTALEHLDDLWAYFAGLPPEADAAPDATWRGWMRMVVAQTGDGNRWRWVTDPVWHLVQRAGFGEVPPASLVRIPAVRHDLNQVDAELYGLFKLRAALRGEFLEETATLSLELRDFAQCMEEVDGVKGRDFADEVREKARRMGKPVPIRVGGPLPVAGNFGAARRRD